MKKIVFALLLLSALTQGHSQSKRALNLRSSSGGVGATIDATPTSGSANAVSSGGAYTALSGKSPVGHVHTTSDITSLQAFIRSSISGTNYNQSTGVIDFSGAGGGGGELSTSQIESIQDRVYVTNLAFGNALSTDPHEARLAIQAAANYAAYSSDAHRRVVLYWPAADYKFDSTIQVTDGDGRLGSVIWYGEGGNFPYDQNFRGVDLEFMSGIGNAVEIQGGYNILIQGFLLRGQNYAQASYGTPQLTRSNYLIMQTGYENANADSRNNAYTGFHVDPKSGSGFYPSSIVKFYKVNVQHFADAFSVQGGLNSDGQGEFVGVYESMAKYCVNGLTVGGTQSRLTIVQDSWFDQVYTGITNYERGKQNGRIVASIHNHYSGYRMINLGEMTTNAGFLSMNDYLESEALIGYGGNDNTGSGTVTFMNDNFSLGHFQETAIPTSIFRGAKVAFYSTTVSGLNLDMDISHSFFAVNSHFKIDNTFAYDDLYHQQDHIGVWSKAISHNPFYVGALQRAKLINCDISFDNYTFDIDEDAWGTLAYNKYPKFPGYQSGTTGLLHDALWKSTPNGLYTLSSRTYSGKSLTFTLSSWDNPVVAAAMKEGDYLVIRKNNSFVKYMIISRSGNFITCIRVSGFQYNGSTYAFYQNYDFDPAILTDVTSEVTWYNNNMPETRPTVGTTNGTATISGLSPLFYAPDNGSINFAGQFSIGDILNAYTFDEGIPDRNTSPIFQSVITGINTASGTITVSTPFPFSSVNTLIYCYKPQL